MITYQLDYVVEETLKNVPTSEQFFLREFLKTDVSKAEAAYLCERIADHKWYISERLSRDVGNRVAAIDFFENIYEPGKGFNSKTTRGGLMKRLLGPLNSSVRAYFVSKSQILPQ